MNIAKCNTCGADMPEIMNFCTSCGSKADHTTVLPVIPVYVGENASATKFSFDFNSLKKFIKPVIAAAIAMVAIIVAVNIFIPAKYESSKGTVYIASGDGSVIIIPNGGSKVEIDGTLMNSARSLDGTKAAALISEGSVQTGLLYLITDRPQIIMDEVYAFWLSANGNAVAYITEHNPHDGTAELWLHSDGKNTRISSDYYAHGSCAISPNGKVVAFVTADGDRHTGIVWDDKINELGRGTSPVAISDNARYIYYIRDDSLYVQNGLKGDDREKLGDNVNSIIVSKDLSQVIYNSNSRAYISRKGGAREALSGSIGSFVLPMGTGSTYMTNNVRILGVTNFSNTFYRNTDSAIIRINSKYETDSVVRSVNNAYLANDGRTLTYMRNDRIYKVNGMAPQAEPIQIVSGEVTSFIATSNGSAVYFVNDASELLYQKETGKPTTVTSDFSSRSAYSLFKGSTLFYVSDKELFVSTGARGRRVSGFDGDVQSVSADLFSVDVISSEYGDTSYYRSTDGNKFDLISQGSTLRQSFFNQDYTPTFATQLNGTYRSRNYDFDLIFFGNTIIISYDGYNTQDGTYVINGDRITITWEGSHPWEGHYQSDGDTIWIDGERFVKQ
ncbi:MAG: zinc ribbon domain-containing protein [Oscillospiraceae bacterium]|nr:zinc ribbon domain-containing protein [Oscillospiraceae bacterium]